MSIEVTNDPSQVDFDKLMAWLGGSYWASGRSADREARALEGSLCFIAVDGGEMVGFARVVTDRATFGWLCDVIVDPEFRGNGIGKALMQAVRDHPDLRGARIILATKDAHGLYASYGFEALANPDNWMMQRFPE